MNQLAMAAARQYLEQTPAGKADQFRARLELFAPRTSGCLEDDCSDCVLVERRWQRIHLDLPSGGGETGITLRFNPGNGIGIIDIAGIFIRCRSTNKVLWRARTQSELSQLTICGTAAPLPHRRLLRIFSFGPDTQVVLPACDHLNLPLVFQIWVRLETSPQTIAQSFGHLYSDYWTAEQELGKLKQDRSTLDRELRRTARSLEDARDGNASKRAELIALRADLQCVERELWENKVRRADLTARLNDRDRWIQDVRNSPAWKMMKPFWKLQRHFSRSRCASPQQQKRGQLIFAIDPPDSSAASANVLKIKGWCFAHGGPETVGVRAKIGGKSYFARYGLKRRDLARKAGDYPAALHSGFSLNIPIPPDSSCVRLEAIAQGGSWECFFEQPIPNQAGAGKESGNKADVFEVDAAGTLSPDAYEQESLALYPTITVGEVASVLDPLIEQHRKRLGSAVPFFSIVTPIPTVLPRWIAEAGASLLSQTFAHWEWCLILHPQQDSQLGEMLEPLAAAHTAFRLLRPDRDYAGGDANYGIEAATGEAVCFLNPSDILHRDALAMMAAKLREGFDAVYSDEDKFDEKTGRVIEPFFKPEWSPEYFRGAMYVGHFLAVRRELAARIRLNPAFESVQEFEFMLRISETTARIGHVARSLYHSRKPARQPAKQLETKSRISLLQQNAVNEQLQRLGLPARAEPAATVHRLRIVPSRRTAHPKVSIIIPTKDSPELLSRCLHSLYENTSYSAFETILIDNDTTNAEALAVMRKHPVTRLYLPHPFNFSHANNLAARHATGEYLVFLNNDTEVVAAAWLDYLLYYAEQPDVGAAGALLLHDNGAVQHGGVVLGMRGTGDHAMRGFSAKSDGYLGSLSCAREVSAVTAACMMMRKSLFEQLGGFNEHFFTIYQDLDLCLRLRERGLRIIWTPQALLLHHESISRQKYYDTVDRYLLLDRWQEMIERGDPYYNPNLNLERGDYSNK